MRNEGYTRVRNTLVAGALGLAALVCEGCMTPSDALVSRMADGVNSMAEEDNGVYGLQAELDSAEGPDRRALVLAEYSKEHPDEVRAYLGKEAVERVESFNYASIPSERLAFIENTTGEGFDYDLDLPENPKDYTLGQKIFLYYAEEAGNAHIHGH